MKKNVSNEFDLSMGALNGAEERKSVNLWDFLCTNSLKISLMCPVSCSTEMTGRPLWEATQEAHTDCIRKKNHQGLSNIGLKINVLTVTSANFLHVNLNLETGKHQPYRKPNDETLYFIVNSNHTPTIIKQISASVVKRISSLSVDEETLQKRHQYITVPSTNMDST